MLSKFHPSRNITDGATIRRPRGRPPGSKNKPKPLAVVPPSDPTMAPYILELPPGADVIDSAVRFCRRRDTALCLLSGNGVVSDVTLRQPSSSSAPTVAFRGRFDILSISATILPGGCSPLGGGGAFSLSLAGPQGQVFGGHVVGPLVAAGTIYLVAATFDKASFHRLVEQDDRESDCPAAHEAGGISVYNYHLGSDPVWGPSARPPGF